MLRDLGRDFRYAGRTLLRAPTFAATVIVTLSIGIGANAVIFSAVDAVLLRDAPVADPDSLVEVHTTSGSNLYSSSSYPDYFDLRDSKTFASLAAYTAMSMTLDVNRRPVQLAGQLVSGNYFDVLGITMPYGRGFAADDDRVGAPVRVAVISDALWRRAFTADPAAVGRTIRLNGNAYTLIGVAPPRFVGPVLGVAPDVWVPSALQPEVDPPAAAVRRARGHSAIFDLRRSRGLSLVGRLPSGISIDQARVRADVVASRLQVASPDSNRNRRFTVVHIGEGRGLRVAVRPLLQLLVAAVLAVLLIACVNVASLLLARAASREREIAVRVAVGAGRWRLVRQWLAESVLLGTLGSIGALLIIRVGTPLLHAFVLPDAVDLTVNLRVLTFTLVVGVASGLLFGLAPVWQIVRRSTITALRTQGTVATGFRSASARGVLVVLQVAMTLVLVVAAGLFLRTLDHAYSVDIGYQVDGVVVLPLSLEPHGYFEGGPRGADAGQALYEQILSRVAAIPGVVAASAARMTVLSGGARSTSVSRDGRPIDRDFSNAMGVRANVVSHRYFETLNIPIVRGRAFDASDERNSTRVTIVTRSLAERLWPGDDPIGKPLRDENTELRVVGIVPDTVYTSTVEQRRLPTYYLLLAQNYESSVALHVRVANPAMSLGPRIVEEVRGADPRLAVESPQPLGDILDRTLGRQRMMATLVGLFGAMALLLAAVGLYGLMAYVAKERAPEIGIRLAVGAQPSSILSLLMRQGLRLLAIGLAIGVAGALLGTRYIEAQLFGVTATDPLTFVAAGVVLTLAGVAACVGPTRRAMRIDPIAVLRS